MKKFIIVLFLVLCTFSVGINVNATTYTCKKKNCASYHSDGPGCRALYNDEKVCYHNTYGSISTCLAYAGKASVTDCLESYPDNGYVENGECFFTQSEPCDSNSIFVSKTEASVEPATVQCSFKYCAFFKNQTQCEANFHGNAACEWISGKCSVSTTSIDALNYTVQECSSPDILNNGVCVKTLIAGADGKCSKGVKATEKDLSSYSSSSFSVDDDIDVTEYNGCVIGDVNEVGSFAYYLDKILDIMKYSGIVLTIVLTVKEIIQALTEDNKDMIKNIVKKFSVRMIYVVLLFFLPILVDMILMLIGQSGTCGIGGLG